MKLGIIYDPHIADNAPATRKDDYKEAIFTKLAFVLDKAEKEDYRAVIIAGDLFHKKIPFHNSHSLVRRLINLFDSVKVPIYGVAGNHDIFGNMNAFENQPLSVLCESHALNLLFGEPVLLSDEEIKVSLSGVEFSAARDKKDSKDLYGLKHIEDAHIRLGVFHQMLLPDGMTFFSDYINFEDLKEINSDVIINGHYHVGYENSMVKVHGKYFLNGGALSRGSSDNFNLQKTPIYNELILTRVDNFVDVQCNEIIVPHRPSEEVFDTQAVERRKENEAIKEFTKNLNKFEVESLESSSPESVIRVLGMMGMDASLNEKASYYLNLASDGGKP